MAERPTHKFTKKTRKTEEKLFPVELLKDDKKNEGEKSKQYQEKIMKDKKITVIRYFTDAAGKSATEPKDKEQDKVFNDPIHGHVELHPLLVKIINTPQFDRLRHIKQLGGAYAVFPGACHNRFEHSIGVAHLAGEFAKALQSKQPELGITKEDILCVQIAGLCHDLGHGPFSHLFDTMFIPKACPKLDWKHEKNSRKMFDHMVAENNLEEVMKQYDLKPEEDREFIKEMMTGEPQETATGDQWPYKGRGQDKSFLYEIVANKTNDIDVDKFDYFARDCHHLGIQNHFDHHRFFLFARVCEVDGRRHICVRDKEVHNLYEMFYARCSFHRKAYQHKVNKLIETMIRDAFLKANEHIKIKGKKGEEFTLSEAIDDMEAYTKLTDQVFEQILHSPLKDMEKARDILERIIRRDLYKCVGEILTETTEMTEMVELHWNASFSLDNIDGLTADDFAIVVTALDYGDSENDPIKKVYFYSKEDPDNARLIPTDQVSRLLPEHFYEKSIRIYFKKNDETSLIDAESHFERCFSPP